MTNNATLSALKTELEKTVEDAQRALEQYLSYSQSLQDWQQTVDGFQQLRGIFVMLEHQGAALMCEEAVQLLQFLPVESVAQHDKEFEVLTRSLVLIQKYLEFQELGKAPFPEILLPTVNDLRRARKAVILREGCFHRFNYTIKATTNADNRLTRETKEALRKYRHMFQAGLLYAMREAQPKRALGYMALCLNRVQSALRQTDAADFWYLAALAAEGISKADDHRLSAARRRWYGQLDRQLHNLIRQSNKALQAAPVSSLVQDNLYYIALTAAHSPRLQSFQEAHPDIRLSYNDRQLREQEQLLLAPGSSVLQSVSTALQEEFVKVKDTVDQAAVPNGQFSAYGLRDHLARIADTLDMVGLNSPANVVRRMWELVRGWPDNAVPRQDDLMTIADAILYAESAVSRLNQNGTRYTADDEAAGARNVMLQEAKAAVLDETEAGLSVAKRAVTAYMESQYDNVHLANVPATLGGIKGALMFLQAMEAVVVVDQCIRFVTGLQRNEVRATDIQLEAFADALSSLELYLEGLLAGQDNPDVLRMARASVAQLPSKVKGEA
ncbi:hypothetical protein NFC81_06065 [Salinispirillum sp. LH 10-3-1]|uniref:Scaffold protein FimL second domain-containing protein n=1 Tax=Salinispirillum sp. LH 10-3-1 TaxID=2952525 RepID=A0AB38YIU2_9GAMM